VAVTTTIAN